MASWNPISPYNPISLFWAVLGPWLFLGWVVSHVPATIARLYRSNSLSNLLSPSAFGSALFGTVWTSFGPRLRDNNWNRMVALLEGRVSDGEICATLVGEPVSGTVIEVGPGSGMWAGLFAEPSLQADGNVNDGNNNNNNNNNNTDDGVGAAVRRRKAGAAANGVTKVYGVEPSANMHPQLRASIAEAGLDGVYEIVPVGIESLASSGRVQKGSVDCVVSILCLCSIPEPEKNIRELYTYLKPGGRWYVFEHVRTGSHQGWAMRAYQILVNVFWPRCLGGCQLGRDTARSLRAAGEWSSVDLAYTDREEWCAVCPHVFGILTK